MTDMTDKLNSNSDSSENQKKELAGALLGKTVADLQTMRAGPGLRRFFSAFLLLVLTLTLSYRFGTNEAGFYLFAVLAGIFFAAAAVTTHDAIHHTLTGMKWFDEISARVVTWPVLWPHGVYSELHKLHHKMNGIDARDPERVTYTEEEYATAGKLKRFYIRNQLPLAVFIGGGIGMIIGHLSRATAFLRQSKGLRREIVCDLIGILVVNGTLYAAAAAHGQLGKALLLYFIVERIGGGLLQFRAHIEHYGLSGKRSNYFATQLYSCRNIETHPFMSWLMNGLNFHSIHHAFPKVPFYHLEEATHRMNELLKQNGAEQLPHSKGYLQTFKSLSSQVQLLNMTGTPPAQRKAVHATEYTS
jgi:fatty acid desaturase